MGRSEFHGSSLAKPRALAAASLMFFERVGEPS